MATRCGRTARELKSNIAATKRVVNFVEDGSEDSADMFTLSA